MSGSFRSHKSEIRFSSKLLIHQLQAENATSRTKMLSIRTGSWKERHPGRVARREAKRKAMVNLVLDYYTINTENFFDAAITFFNEF